MLSLLERQTSTMTTASIVPFLFNFRLAFFGIRFRFISVQFWADSFRKTLYCYRWLKSKIIIIIIVIDLVKIRNQSIVANTMKWTPAKCHSIRYVATESKWRRNRNLINSTVTKLISLYRKCLSHISIQPNKDQETSKSGFGNEFNSSEQLRVETSEEIGTDDGSHIDSEKKIEREKKMWIIAI